MLSVRGSVTGEVGGKRTIQLIAKNQRSSSCDDGNSRKGPRVRDNQPFVLNCDTLLFFIGRKTSIVARLEHNPQTNKARQDIGNASRQNNIMLSVNGHNVSFYTKTANAYT